MQPLRRPLRSDLSRALYGRAWAGRDAGLGRGARGSCQPGPLRACPRVKPRMAHILRSIRPDVRTCARFSWSVLAGGRMLAANGPSFDGQPRHQRLVRRSSAARRTAEVPPQPRSADAGRTAAPGSYDLWKRRDRQPRRRPEPERARTSAPAVRTMRSTSTCSSALGTQGVMRLAAPSTASWSSLTVPGEGLAHRGGLRQPASRGSEAAREALDHPRPAPRPAAATRHQEPRRAGRCRSTVDAGLFKGTPAQRVGTVGPALVEAVKRFQEACRAPGRRHRRPQDVRRAPPPLRLAGCGPVAARRSRRPPGSRRSPPRGLALIESFEGLRQRRPPSNDPVMGTPPSATATSCTAGPSPTLTARARVAQRPADPRPAHKSRGTSFCSVSQLER